MSCGPRFSIFDCTLLRATKRSAMNFSRPCPPSTTKTQSISNDFLRKPDERTDSWYPFENGLVKYPAIGSLAGSKEVTDHFLEAFQTAQKMARQYDYLFPIYYRVSTLLAEGAGTNYAIGGLYAWAAILAHRLTGEEHHLEEARRAIQVLYPVPSDRLFHEQ